jgi:hypothetical protein
MKKNPFHALFLLLATGVLATTACVALENAPPASPEVTAAMQPYLDYSPRLTTSCATV